MFCHPQYDETKRHFSYFRELWRYCIKHFCFLRSFFPDFFITGFSMHSQSFINVWISECDTFTVGKLFTWPHYRISQNRINLRILKSSFWIRVCLLCIKVLFFILKSSVSLLESELVLFELKVLPKSVAKGLHVYKGSFL